ncbi:MAG: hypothetical protein AAF637_13160, partial [Pseudomonadota bacterium]
MRIAADILIVGAGIQGLALLDALAPRYSLVLVGSSPMVSETHHWHGYFSSGWNASDRTAAGIYRACASDWQSKLRDAGVEPHQTSFNAALPPEMVQQLSPIWDDAGIGYQEVACPAPFEPSTLPPHQIHRFPDDLVFDASAALQTLRAPHASKMLQGTVHEVRLDDGRIIETIADVAGEQLTTDAGQRQQRSFVACFVDVCELAFA